MLDRGINIKNNATITLHACNNFDKQANPNPNPTPKPNPKPYPNTNPNPNQ